MFTFYHVREGDAKTAHTFKLLLTINKTFPKL